MYIYMWTMPRLIQNLCCTSFSLPEYIFQFTEHICWIPEHILICWTYILDCWTYILNCWTKKEFAEYCYRKPTIAEYCNSIVFENNWCTGFVRKGQLSWRLEGLWFRKMINNPISKKSYNFRVFVYLPN